MGCSPWGLEESDTTERLHFHFSLSCTGEGNGNPFQCMCVCFFFNKFIYFNWRLITLQYCIGFAIHQHESATGIHVFPILNPPPSSFAPYHPSGSSQCTSPKHPVSCIEPGLAIRFIYDIIQVFNAILPNHPTLSLSHRVQNTVLYICVSFDVSHIGLSLPSF